MKVWALVSQKGGAGKSTLATQLAVVAQQAGEKVAIIDLDRQHSAFHWSHLRGGKAPEAVRALPERLAKVLEAAEGMGHTMVIIDTAPQTDVGALEAIKVADLVIVPTKPAEFELAALEETVALLNLANRRHLALGVVNDVTASKSSMAEYDMASARMKTLGLRVCAAYMTHRKAYVEAIASGKAVVESHKTDKAATEVKSLYDELHLLTPSTQNVVTMKGKA